MAALSCMLMLPNICNMLQRVKWWEVMCVTIPEIKPSKESSNLACETIFYTLIRRIVAWILLVELIPRLGKSLRVLKDNAKLLLILELAQPGEVLMKTLNLGTRCTNRQNSFKMLTIFTCSIRRPRTSIILMTESRPSKILTWLITIAITLQDSKIHNRELFWNLQWAINANKSTCQDKRSPSGRANKWISSK